jgi:hypothetical protein
MFSSFAVHAVIIDAGAGMRHPMALEQSLSPLRRLTICDLLCQFLRGSGIAPMLHGASGNMSLLTAIDTFAKVKSETTIITVCQYSQLG